MYDPRSHTDTLTNVVVLSALDLGSHFDEILERDLPISTLPTFLHEATHHWCFDTPVGIALHLLFMRARRAALTALAGRGNGQTESDLVDSVLRYELMDAFTRPISEGLALFAEHDAIPGEARTISTPMMLAGGLYGRGYAVAGDQPWAGLPVVLAGARVARSHVRRKAALLLEPLSCDRGGYLPGYLFIKSIWGYACQVSELFQDSDFFLQYLRAYIYDDWGLVARLLDDDRKDFDALEPITQYVAHRLRQFLEVSIHGDLPARFETITLEKRTEQLHVETELISLNLDYLPLALSEDVELGTQRLQAGLSSYFDRWPEDEDEGDLVALDRGELLQRSVINLGSVAAEARFSANGMEIDLNFQHVATVPPAQLSNSTEPDGPIDLEFLTTNKPGTLCLAVMRGPNLICLVAPKSFEGAEGLKRVIRSHNARRRRIDLSQNLIDAALRQSSAESWHDTLARQMIERLNEWFLPIALSHVDGEQLPEMMHKMREDGLLNVLDGDRGLVLDTAVASLVVPSPYNFDSVASFHTWSTGAPTTSIARITQRLRESLGLVPFLVKDGTFVQTSFI